MPLKMKMLITNQNRTPLQNQVNSVGLRSQGSRAPNSFNSSIISRIHNAKAGCGTCGRH